MNRNRIFFFLIKLQKDLTTFVKQGEPECVTQVSDPQLPHGQCTPAIILIFVLKD